MEKGVSKFSVPVQVLVLSRGAERPSWSTTKERRISIRDVRSVRGGTGRGRALGKESGVRTPLHDILRHRGGMESMRHDLGDALADTSVHDPFMCVKCGAKAAPGRKLHYCGRCRSSRYCSTSCLKADWDAHKGECDTRREMRDAQLANHRALGGRSKDYKSYPDHESPCEITATIPGLDNEIQLLAWKHRGKSPLIHVSSCFGDGSDVRIIMMPRSFWEDDPGFADFAGEHTIEAIGQIRRLFEVYLNGTSVPGDFCADKQYVTAKSKDVLGHPDGCLTVTSQITFSQQLIRGAEIVDALTTATRAEDLADAFAWFEAGAVWTIAPQQVLQEIRRRSTVVHGGTTPPGSVPVPSRGLNNEVAYMMMSGMGLKFDVRLTGLVAAAHLNGRKGVIRQDQDRIPTDYDRWRVRLDDGTHIDAKAVNLVHIRPEDYRRIKP